MAVEQRGLQRGEKALGQSMDEHARFVAHLLDPDEYDLIDKAMRRLTFSAHCTAVARFERPPLWPRREAMKFVDELKRAE